MTTFNLGGRRMGVVAAFCAALLVMAGQAGAAFIWDFDNPPAQGPTIQELLDTHDGQIQVGDKIFNFFNDSVTTSATVGTVAPGADAIRVAGIRVPAGTGDFGLRFNGGWSAGGQEIADTTLLFRVDIAEPELSSGFRLHDNALWISAFGVSGTGQGGVVSVSENVYVLNPRENAPSVNPSIANKFVYYRSDTDQEVMDAAEFKTPAGAPLELPSIWVLKDVVANGGDLTVGAAHLSEFYQTFSQTVIPEPATMGLLALGGLSMLAAGLRRRFARV